MLDTADLSISFDTVPGDERGKLQIVFLVENKTDSELNDLTITVTDSLTVRVAKSGTSNCTLDSLAAGQKQHVEAAAIATSVQPQKLKVSVAFEYLAEPRKEDTVLLLPVSAFIAATPLSKDQFASILTSESVPLALSSTRVKPQSDFKTAVAAITSTLHLEPVQVGAENASAYGKSVQGHHVALRLKAANGEVAVDVKASEVAIGNALVQEVAALFR